MTIKYVMKGKTGEGKLRQRSNHFDTECSDCEQWANGVTKTLHSLITKAEALYDIKIEVYVDGFKLLNGDFDFIGYVEHLSEKEDL